MTANTAPLRAALATISATFTLHRIRAGRYRWTVEREGESASGTTAYGRPMRALEELLRSAERLIETNGGDGTVAENRAAHDATNEILKVVGPRGLDQLSGALRG